MSLEIRPEASAETREALLAVLALELAGDDTDSPWWRAGLEESDGTLPSTAPWEWTDA